MGRLIRALLCLALLAGLAVAPTAGAAPADPTRPGPRSLTLLPYDEGTAVLAVAPANAAPQPVDVRGELTVPAGAGSFPVVVLLHGRHSTCRYADITETLGHPCPDTPVTASVRSYEGYRYLARNLASHGYLVASIDANGINTFDTGALDSGALARAELVSRTLDLLGAWGAGSGTHGGALRGRVDLRRIGLMGHSRGGEGVTRWLAYNRDRTDGPRYPASGVLALAPTDFDDHVVTDATPYAVVLPRCDGDVSDLQGADVFERSQYVSQGPLHQLTVEGANHNWFNSVWTGDDIGGTSDRNCTTEAGGRRLTAAQQERVGLALMGAFFRRYVGGERGFEPLLTGRGRPTWACSPRMTMTCGDLLDVSWQPGPRARTTLLVPGLSGTTLSSPGARLVPGPGLELEGCQRTTCPRQGRNSDLNRSGGPQAVLTWTQPSSLTLVAAGRWRGHPRGDLVLRLGANAGPQQHELGTGRLRLRVQVADTRGRTATVRITPATGAPEPPPGDLVRNLLLADARVPLAAFRGVDATSLRSVRLLLDEPTGSLQLADVALHQP